MTNLRSFQLKVCKLVFSPELGAHTYPPPAFIDWDDGKQERDLHQWDDNWEDDDQGEDDFSVQLRYPYFWHFRSDILQT